MNTISTGKWYKDKILKKNNNKTRKYNWKIMIYKYNSVKKVYPKLFVRNTIYYHSYSTLFVYSRLRPICDNDLTIVYLLPCAIKFNLI